MGFKRTTEGRVFFQRSKETANDQPDRDAGEPLQPAFMPEDIFPQPERPASGPQEILAVLRALNERLKSTQSERQEMRRQLGIYRTLMEELEEKAERSERAWLELEEKFSVRNRTAESRAEQAETIARDTLRELEETRRIVADLEDKADLAGKSVSSLKKLQAEQDQKLSGYGAVHVKLSQRLQDTELKQEDMGGKIEEALSQQARLGRKLDKAVEDRARFMRKIERIEETVIQTRDALNARAMVLLTDQAAGGGPALEEDFPPESMLDMRPGGFDALPGAASTARSPWFQAVAVGAVILAAALAGWFAAELRRPGVFPVSGDFSITEPRNLESPNSPARDLSAMEPRAGEIREESAEDSIQAIPEAYAPRTAVLPEAQDDIGMLDLENDEKLLDLLDENPDLLAESLNAIEPGEVEIAEATVEKAGEQVAPAPAAQSEKTDDPGQDLSQAGFTAPDPRLPAAIQKVEAEALRGVAEAQHDLAAVYTAGHAGVSRDYTRAAFWFRKAADQGVANAAYNLGVLNHQGLGVPVDIKAAIGWYEKAAELGHPEAQYNLGIAYIEGVGVTYMPQKAARYFEAAAAEGVLEAAYNLGLIYENGLLGKPEPDKALMWYKRAADKGNPEAKAALSQLAKSLDMDVNEVNGIVESLKEGDRKAETPVAPVSVPDKTISRENARLSPVVAPGAPVRETREAGLQAPPPNQALLAQVQDYLMKSGLYPGPADGRGGPLTEDAIRSYQSLNGLSVDGRANEKLLAHMLTNPGDYLKN